MARDFKYDWLTHGTEPWTVESVEIKNDYLRGPLYNFHTSMSRTAILASMPMMLAWFVRRDQQFMTNAVFRVTGKGDYTLNEIADLDFTPEIEKELRKQLDDHSKVRDEDISSIRLQLGAQYVIGLLATSPGMETSMDAIYTSIILEAWTAFEFFASDLWAIALDKGPRHLANALVYSNELKKSDENITTKVLDFIGCSLKR